MEGLTEDTDVKEVSLGGTVKQSQAPLSTADLSPKTQKKMDFLLKSLARKEAFLQEDERGRISVKYSDSKVIPALCYVDKSESNTIQQPKTEEDMAKRIGSLLELIKFAKENRTPSGLVLDKTKITTKSRKYRLGEEFKETGEILGKGNVAGDILVVKDVGSGTSHALKTVMISEFRENEVKCWVDLEGTGICPSLYLIRLENNIINLHMEELKQAITLNDILEKHAIPEPFRQPFCLYIYKGLLSAVKTMHDKNWTHRDLHPGNVMIQKNTRSSTLDIKVLDFGKANRIYDEKQGVDYAGKDDDILQIVRLFSALYTGQLFDSALDLKKNYKSKLVEMANILKFSYDDRVELFQLVELALILTSRSQQSCDTNTDDSQTVKTIEDAISEIDRKLKSVNIDEMSKKVAAILFSENEYHDLHTDSDLGSKGSGNDFVDSSETLSLEEKAARIPDDFIRGLREGLTIGPQQPQS